MVNQESVPLIPVTQNHVVQDSGRESHVATAHCSGASPNFCAVKSQDLVQNNSVK